MCKRNHYTQTNGPMIAELDYKPTEPVVRVKYLCGGESCTYKGTIVDLIDHVQGQHVSHKSLVCKRCRREHESLALFISHLGGKSCRRNTSDEDSGGGRAISSDLLQQPVDTLSSPYHETSSPSTDTTLRLPTATDQTEASCPTTEMGRGVARTGQQFLLSSTMQASSMAQSDALPDVSLNCPDSPGRTYPSLPKRPAGKLRTKSGRGPIGARATADREAVELDSTSVDSRPFSVRPTHRSPPQKGREAAVIDVNSSDTESATLKSASKDGRQQKVDPFCARWTDLAGSEATKFFFKCIISSCKVTSNNAMEFFVHLISHACEDLLNLPCIYCESTFDASDAMALHMTEEHGRRTYQCGWCIYRAAAEWLPMLHLRLSRADKEALSYNCDCTDAAVDSLPQDELGLTDYHRGVTGCNFGSFNLPCFEQHYKSNHKGTNMTGYLRSTCDVVLETVDALDKRCTVHGLNTAQCTYCRHGTATFREMPTHLSDSHADDYQLNFFIRTPWERRRF